jgi:hypothetical protein
MIKQSTNHFSPPPTLGANLFRWNLSMYVGVWDKGDLVSRSNTNTGLFKNQPRTRRLESATRKTRTKEIRKRRYRGYIYKHSNARLKHVTPLTTPETPYAYDNTSIQPTTADTTTEQIDTPRRGASDSG